MTGILIMTPEWAAVKGCVRVRIERRTGCGTGDERARR
jgi:hypothetical protein